MLGTSNMPARRKGVLASNGARLAIAFVVVLALAIGWFLLHRGELPGRVH